MDLFPDDVDADGHHVLGINAKPWSHELADEPAFEEDEEEVE
jgi:hypothetical protein